MKCDDTNVTEKSCLSPVNLSGDVVYSESGKVIAFPPDDFVIPIVNT